MSLLETPAKFDAEKALHVLIGLMSPIWLPIAGAAAMGLAAWNFSRWMRLASPEAALELKPVVPEVAEPVVEAVAETVALAADPVTEAPLPVVEPEVVASPVETVAAVAEAQAEAVKPVVKAAKVAVKKTTQAAAKKPAVRKARPTAH